MVYLKQKRSFYHIFEDYVKKNIFSVDNTFCRLYLIFYLLQRHIEGCQHTFLVISYILPVVGTNSGLSTHFVGYILYFTCCRYIFRVVNTLCWLYIVYYLLQEHIQGCQHILQAIFYILPVVGTYLGLPTYFVGNTLYITC